jgi:hypothetical protein
LWARMAWHCAALMMPASTACRRRESGMVSIEIGRGTGPCRFVRQPTIVPATVRHDARKLAHLDGTAIEYLADSIDEVCFHDWHTKSRSKGPAGTGSRLLPPRLSLETINPPAD